MCALSLSCSFYSACPGGLVVCDYSELSATVECALTVGFKCTGAYGVAAELAYNAAMCSIAIGNALSRRRDVDTGQQIEYSAYPLPSRARRDAEKDAAAEAMVRTSAMLVNHRLFYREIVGVEAILSLASPQWGDAFLATRADTSELGSGIGGTELASLIAQLPVTVNESDARLFLTRWNRTVNNWKTGIFGPADITANQSSDFANYTETQRRFKQYLVDTRAVQREGYHNIMDAHIATVEAFKLAISRKPAGVCAKVVIKIEQDLVLTRTGFLARLELTNSGEQPLQNISVRS